VGKETSWYAVQPQERRAKWSLKAKGIEYKYLRRWISIVLNHILIIHLFIPLNLSRCQETIITDCDVRF
jgi:hypothetical protein